MCITSQLDPRNRVFSTNPKSVLVKNANNDYNASYIQLFTSVLAPVLTPCSAETGNPPGK